MDEGVILDGELVPAQHALLTHPPYQRGELVKQKRHLLHDAFHQSRAVLKPTVHHFLDQVLPWSGAAGQARSLPQIPFLMAFFTSEGGY